MSFASDKLWNGYLRRNMSTIVSKVKVREIVPYLQCLTTHDRENIEAKRETSGNYDAMNVLLDCLKRRENWAEQFIEGLEACEQSKLAAEMRAEYRALAGLNNSGPVPSPTTVARAHVHPAPAATQLPIPGSGGNVHAAVAVPAETPPATPEQAAQAPSSVETPPQQQAVQVSEVAPPSEPDPEPLASTEEDPRLPSTPPPSPEISHVQAAKAPRPQEMVLSHQEPEENSESNTQAVPGDTSLIPEEVNSGNKEVAVSVLVPPREHHPVPTSETSTSPPDHFHSAVTTNDKPPHSPDLGSSSVPTTTPEKQPVQDTTPPVSKVPTAALLASNPAATQVVISSPLTGHAASTSPDGMNASCVDGDYETVFLSKPNQLLSFQPEIPASPVQASDPLVQLYSGDSGRLEISQDSSDTLTPALSCHENGTATNQNEPEENHYESPNQSMEEVLENVVCVSEMPSVSNLDGQTMVPRDEIINKSTPEPPVFTNATLPWSNPPHRENNNPSESKSQQISEEKIAPYTTPCQSNNVKYFLVAAGVGVCALLMIWKFKK